MKTRLTSKTHFLNLSKELRTQRILTRNTEKGATFESKRTDKNFEFIEFWFEVPTKEVVKNSIIIS
jgi:hypothetical protein